MAEKIQIEVPEPNIQKIKLTLVGTSPLIQHQFSAKAKKQILDKQMKKAQKAKATREPKKEFENSLYLIKTGKFVYPKTGGFPMKVKFSGEIGIPALWVKQAAVASARNLTDVTMTFLRGALFVEARAEDGLVEVRYDELMLREDIVRIGRGSSDLRYRGQLNGWETDIVIKFNADVLSAEQVINLIKISGYSSGVGEWRPARNGDFGCFDVKPFKEKKK